MLRSTRLIQMSSCLWFTTMCCVGSSLADGGASKSFYKQVLSNDLDLFHLVPVFFSIFFATVVTEYLIVYFLLGRPEKATAKLLLCVLLVNVITNPAAQFGMLLLGDERLLGSATLPDVMICMIELTATAVESALMVPIFGRLYRCGLLDEPVTVRRTIVIVLAANVASFLVGFGVILMMAAVITWILGIFLWVISFCTV
jgi:hypothetical protein